MENLKLTLEELVYQRFGQFLDELHGSKVPDLYRVLMEQVDRAVVRQAVERSQGQILAAAQLLDLDRNTLARKVRRLLPRQPTRKTPRRAKGT